MGDRFVRPETTRLELSKGDWVIVWKRLNAGQNKRMAKRGSIQTEDGRRFDSIEAGTAKMLAYLVDWSITGPDGEIIPIRGQADDVIEKGFDSIDPVSYKEILNAIEAHEKAMDTARAEEKKVTPTGTPTSGETSPSPSDVAGALIGSAP